MRKTMFSKRTLILLTIGLLGVERAAAQFLGIELLPGVGNDTDLLLLWGIGHCDGMDGPVVVLAKKALSTGNVNFVLPWVRPEDEPEVRHAFDHALAVRDLGPQARTLADQHFFETLVRIHRAGEGAPFTGLQPAGRDLGPAIPAADKALVDGSIDTVVTFLSDSIREGLRNHFQAAFERRTFDANDVSAGREYVEAYVPYIHYVERLWEDATATAHGHGPAHGAHRH